MALLELSVMPLGTGTPSVSKYVVGAMKELQKEKDLKFEFCSMGTTIEGDLDRLLAVARRMHESAFTAGAQRVVTTIKIDDRRDEVAGIQTKINTVKRQLGQ